MNEIIFIVKEDEAGGYSARAVGYSIFTQTETREELEEMVRDAVRCHFEPEETMPKLIRLHYVNDAERVSAVRALDYLEERGRRGDPDRFLAALRSAPDVEPDPEDRIE